MKTSTGSCTTLVAIAGGILAFASASVAETATTVQTTSADANARIAEVMDEVSRFGRAQVMAELTPEMLENVTPHYGRNYQPVTFPEDPCDSCATDHVPFAEDDTLAPSPANPLGSNLPTCVGLTDTNPADGIPDVGWLGANDHCWSPGTYPDYEDPDLKEFMGSLSAIGDTLRGCGQLGRVDNSAVAGARPWDPDIWEFEVQNFPQTVQMQVQSEIENVRFIMTYNFRTGSQFDTFDPITDCSDRYGIFVFPVWQTFDVFSPPNCGVATWTETLQVGWWYIIAYTSTGDVDLTAGCENWYNLTVSSIDPSGACCLPSGVDTCLVLLKSDCFAQGGIFGGDGTTCGDVSCCRPVDDLILPIDFEEDGAFGELRCSDIAAQQVNPGCVRDANFLVIQSGATELVEQDIASPSFGQPIDLCSLGQPYVIVGYAGTQDDWSSSFATSDLAGGELDLFMFFVPNAGGDKQIAVTYKAGFSFIGYIVQNLGTTQSSQSCDFPTFLSTGLQNPCEESDQLDTCVRAGNNHGLLMQQFAVSDVSCDSAYTIVVECTDCNTGACCLYDGSCVDDQTAPFCEDSLGGVFQGEDVTCCAVECAQPCDDQNFPMGPAVTDDDCTANEPNGDFTNSGCDAVDDLTNRYYSLLAAPQDQAWCGSNGLIEQNNPSFPPAQLEPDNDYYVIDLSGQAGDTLVTVDIESQIGLDVYVVRGFIAGPVSMCPGAACNLTGCPAGGTDIRDDTRTTQVVGGGTDFAFNICLSNEVHILIVESTFVVECGADYNASISYDTNGCFGACCFTDGTCQAVAENSELQAIAPPACQALGGTYRGLGSECLDGMGMSICCDIDSSGQDVTDADIDVCPTNGANNVNGGCSSSNGSFQALGTLDPGTEQSVSVGGTSGWAEIPIVGTKFIDFDFYTFDVTADAELALTWNAEFSGEVIYYSATVLDPAGACDVSSSDRDVFINDLNGVGADGPCGVGVIAVLSGNDEQGLPDCASAAESHYIRVGANPQPEPCDADYVFTLQVFPCQVGACCLDAAICVPDQGFLECELINGGTFAGNGTDCPENDADLCNGACCVPDGQGGFNCSDNIGFRDCCITLMGEFAGYFEACGDGTICFPTGACCVDGPNGFACTEETQAACATAGGTYQGDDTTCAGTGCDSLTGACCIGAVCTDGTSPDECTTLGGTFQGAGTDCGSVQCVTGGACCVFNCNGAVAESCLQTASQADCENLGGTYRGDGTDCAGANCVAGVDFCLGDLNFDGDTLLADFGIFSANFGSTVPVGTLGDLNCDGEVLLGDFGIFSANFGCTSTGGP